MNSPIQMYDNAFRAARERAAALGSQNARKVAAAVWADTIRSETNGWPWPGVEWNFRAYAAGYVAGASAS